MSTQRRKPAGLSIILVIAILIVAGLSYLYLTDTSQGASPWQKIRNRTEELTRPMVEFFVGKDPKTNRTKTQEEEIENNRNSLILTVSTFKGTVSREDRKDLALDIVQAAESLSESIAMPMSDMDITMGMAFGKDADEVGLNRTYAERVQDPRCWEDYRLRHIYTIKNSCDSYICAGEDESIQELEDTFLSAVNTFIEFSCTDPD